MMEDAERLIREDKEAEIEVERHDLGALEWYYKTYKTQQERIKHCRYYKKKAGSKKENIGLAGCEERWILSSVNDKLSDLSLYLEFGLEMFNLSDEVPISLKAHLFQRQLHWSGGLGNEAEDFKKWYLKYYLKR